jgi:hypothetical protein
MDDKLELNGNFKNHDLSAPEDISSKLTKYLIGRFTPEVIGNKIAELLEATHVTNGGKLIVDNRAREAGLKLALAYTIGLPIVRQEIKTHTIFETSEDVLKRAENSPAFKRSVAELHERFTKQAKATVVSG